MSIFVLSFSELLHNQHFEQKNDRRSFRPSPGDIFVYAYTNIVFFAVGGAANSNELMLDILACQFLVHSGVFLHLHFPVVHLFFASLVYHIGRTSWCIPGMLEKGQGRHLHSCNVWFFPLDHSPFSSGID